MAKTALEVRNVSKTFKLPHEKQGSVKGLFLNVFRMNRTYELQKALNNISFEVKEGEFFGIVGRNGSGKSTLLKLLAGVYTPTSGAVKVNDKLTPFIELGVGFNPELTGRDNVYLNGALLGFSTKEMAAMYEDIIEFAELEKFMDQKLKNYSSGMQVRLAFSIAIQAKSPILLLDEVLAVGDEAFQRKCLDVFEKYKAEKQTIILVTHDMETVRKFCNRAMLINDGNIIEIGNPRDIADKYSQLNQKMINDGVEKYNKKNIEGRYLKAYITDAKLKRESGFNFGEPMIVHISWTGLKSDNIESIGIHLFKLSGEHLTGINTRTGNLKKNWKDMGHIAIEFKLDILPGKYYIAVETFEAEGRIIDSIRTGLQFTVANTKMQWSGLVELPHVWHENVEEETK